jgi:hypothetical protein
MRRLCNISEITIQPGEWGFTVRNGSKWADVLPGDTIELCYCPNITDHTAVGLGLIREVWSGQYSNIPARMVESNNKEKCRTYEGLKAEMRKAYGDNFTDDSLVVALGYRRIS